MATARPVVSVFGTDGASKKSVSMPAVFSAPLRADIVRVVHTGMNKNKRQAHGVKYEAGYDTAAASWGTGRAVARIPRVPGGGTHRSGQGAFGNMCRKGRMFAPLKVWRRWHRTGNKNQKRHAVASALAASAVAPLVLARGHAVNHVPELPLVVDSLNVDSTKAMLAGLHHIGATDDLRRVRMSKSSRAGFNKMRYSRFKMAKGPLIVYGDENPNLKRTARNLPGIDTCSVHRLNLLQLAPGGHLGRFIIFTKDAFDELNDVFGTYTSPSEEKKGYTIPRPVMTCADLSRIITSDQVQAKLNDIKHSVRVHDKTKKNPLKNKAIMNRLNPYAAKAAELRAKAEKERHAKRAKVIKGRTTEDIAKLPLMLQSSAHSFLDSPHGRSFRSDTRMTPEDRRAVSRVTSAPELSRPQNSVSTVGSRPHSQPGGLRLPSVPSSR